MDRGGPRRIHSRGARPPAGEVRLSPRRPAKSTRARVRAEQRTPKLDTDLLRAVLEHSADVIALVDREGTIIYSTPGSGRLLGYTAEEMTGRSAFDFVHPGDVAQARDLLASLLEKPEVAITADLRGLRKDGSSPTVELVALNR